MPHVTFIHGIANKPAPAALLREWTDALGRASNPFDLEASGVTSEMVYWADVLHPAPVSAAAVEAGTMAYEIAGADNPTDEIAEISADTPTEAAWVDAMTQRLGLSELGDTGEPAAPLAETGNTVASNLERIPVPWPLKKRFLKSYLRDVHHYLFNETHSPRPGDTYKVQDEIRRRFVEAIQRGSEKPGPHVVVSHSMGTVVAYDCLKRLDCPGVDHLMTLGSPLGIDEIQDQLLPEWTRDDGFPSDKLRGRWVNYFDPLDVVARLDPYLANDYRQDGEMVITDAKQSGTGVWRHSIDLYLSGAGVCGALRDLLEA